MSLSRHYYKQHWIPKKRASILRFWTRITYVRDFFKYLSFNVYTCETWRSCIPGTPRWWSSPCRWVSWGCSRTWAVRGWESVAASRHPLVSAGAGPAGHHPPGRQHRSWTLQIRAANDPSVFKIMEKAPTRAFSAFSWLEAPTGFTVRHYYDTLLSGCEIGTPTQLS